MSLLWHLWCIILLYSYQYLHICSSSSPSSSLTSDLFENWSQEYEKSYSSEHEKQYRIKVFKENYDYITQHNSKVSSNYTLSCNAYVDLTHHEFKAKYLLGRPRLSSINLEPFSFLEALATAKPISVGICGSNRAFQFYSKGIFTGPCCDTLDHSVLIEGYGSRNGEEYWNVKNSWGKSWGRNGYMQLAIWNWNACGINREVAFMNYRDKKTSSNPPITPLGTKCFPVKCLYGSTCCCYKRVIEQCKDFGCCAPNNPVCCKVNRSCCTLATPNCDEGKSGCYKKSGNVTLAIPIQSEMGGLSAMLGN